MARDCVSNCNAASTRAWLASSWRNVIASSPSWARTARPRTCPSVPGNVTVNSLSVQSTTLDDVFVHYTGRALRDELQDAKVTDSPFMIRRS